MTVKTKIKLILLKLGIRPKWMFYQAPQIDGEYYNDFAKFVLNS
jgi:hypothetical protein